jgi:hypothetical protein
MNSIYNEQLYTEYEKSGTHFNIEYACLEEAAIAGTQKKTTALEKSRNNCWASQLYISWLWVETPSNG